MFEARAVGHLRPPTADQVAEYAKGLHLHPTPEALALITAMVSGMVDGANRLDDLDEPYVPLRYTDRDPGHSPRHGEDPYNAFIRFCTVKGAADGKLAGKTLAVKDSIAVAGIPMTNGGRRVPVLTPTEDATVVERLLDAGCTIIGKTNLEDLAAGLGEASFYGAARNPVNPRFATGGSSSGSAAAVAAGLADLALGADEAGSVRIPAAWCGLVGIKATHGLVPSYGMSYMDHTIDHIGPMTRTVLDNALMLEVMAGPDWRDPQWVRGDLTSQPYASTAGAGIEGMKIGIVEEALAPIGCTDDVLEAFEASVKTLTALGATIEEVSIPLWADAWSIEGTVLNVGLAQMHHSYGQGYGHMGRIDLATMAVTAAQERLGADDLPMFIKAILINAAYMRDEYLNQYYGKAQNLRLELRRQVDEQLSACDVLITPTTPTVANELFNGRVTEEAMLSRFMETISAVLNTCALDLTGHPGLTVPAGTGADDLPVGLQLIGRRFDEMSLYKAAFAFEGA